MTARRRTDLTTFKRSDYTTKRFPSEKTNDTSYYVFNRESKIMAGPFPKWKDGNDWIEERVAEQQRKR